MHMIILYHYRHARSAPISSQSKAWNAVHSMWCMHLSSYTILATTYKLNKAMSTSSSVRLHYVSKSALLIPNIRSLLASVGALLYASVFATPVHKIHSEVLHIEDRTQDRKSSKRALEGISQNLAKQLQ